MKIEDMDISYRTYACLKRGGVNTLDDVLAKTEKDLKQFRNMGRNSIEDVKRCLSNLGLTLQQDTR